MDRASSILDVTCFVLRTLPNEGRRSRVVACTYDCLVRLYLNAYLLVSDGLKFALCSFLGCSQMLRSLALHRGQGEVENVDVPPMEHAARSRLSGSLGSFDRPYD